jgi:hypothetical protein
MADAPRGRRCWGDWPRRGDGQAVSHSTDEVPGMISRLYVALIWVTALLLTATPATPQDTAADPLEAAKTVDPETWSDYSVKAYTIQFFGGRFGGAEYLNLPAQPNPRTREEIGANRVMGFDGSWWEINELDYNIFQAPIKQIEDGTTFGMKIGSYLADHFHIDLVFSYTRTEAVLTMLNTEDRFSHVREEIDRDTNVQIYRGALQLMYDLDQANLYGVRPYVGFGFGGIINRFSALDDVGELYLVGTLGFRREISGLLSGFVEGNLTAFSMSREELHYTKSVTYSDIAAGISFYLDRVPADIRAQHVLQQAESKRRR